MLRQAGALFRIDLRVGIVRVAVGISIDIRISVLIRVAVHVGISIDIRWAVDVWKDSAILSSRISSRVLRQVAAAVTVYARARAANVWRQLWSKNAVRRS